MQRKWTIGKSAPALLAVLFLLAGSGCRTSEVLVTPAYKGQRAADGKPAIANLQAVNYGYFLFGLVPLWSGDPKRPNSKHYITCRDRISDRYNRMAMEFVMYQRLHGGEIADYSSIEHFSGWTTLFLIWRKVLSSKAVVVPAGQVEPSATTGQ